MNDDKDAAFAILEAAGGLPMILACEYPRSKNPETDEDVSSCFIVECCCFCLSPHWVCTEHARDDIWSVRGFGICRACENSLSMLSPPQVELMQRTAFAYATALGRNVIAQSPKSKKVESP